MAKATKQDVIELLLEQHSEIKRLFSRVSKARGAQKRDLFEDLVRLLAIHETAEEEIVHPTARKEISGGEQIVDRRIEEESKAKQALSDLYDLGVDHADFDSRLVALATEVEEHATREENDEFPSLRRKVSADQLQRMATAVKAAEATAPTRPHPAAGESAAANLLAGPPLGVFDRVQDALRDWRRSHG
jgi:hemerythrin-like domain-containing protein